MSVKAFDWAWAQRSYGQEIGKPLPLSDRFLLMTLADHVGRNDVMSASYVSRDDLARAAGMGDSTVFDALGRLEEAELLRVYAVFPLRGGRQLANRYVLNLEDLHGEHWPRWADDIARAEELSENSIMHRSEVASAARRKAGTQMPLIPRTRKAKEPAAPPTDPTFEETDPLSDHTVAASDLAVWQKALRDLRIQVARPSDHETWFIKSGLHPYSCSPDSWVLAADNPLVVDWLTLKCRRLVERVLTDILGHPVEATFIATPASK